MVSIDIFSIRMGKVDLNESNYPRPCIILNQSGNIVFVMLISSSMSIKRPTCFLIDEKNPNFNSTGLVRTSYVLEDILEIKVDKLRKEIGKLEGELLKQFQDWVGCAS